MYNFRSGCHGVKEDNIYACDLIFFDSFLDEIRLSTQLGGVIFEQGELLDWALWSRGSYCAEYSPRDFKMAQIFRNDIRLINKPSTSLFCMYFFDWAGHSGVSFSTTTLLILIIDDSGRSSTLLLPSIHVCLRFGYHCCYRWLGAVRGGVLENVTNSPTS